METNRTPAPETPWTPPPICRSETDPRPRRLDRHFVCAAHRHSLEYAAARDGLRLRKHVLAPAGPLATGRRLETPASGVADGLAAPRRPRSGPPDRRQCLASRAARGKKTGPNPT